MCQYRYQSAHQQHTNNVVRWHTGVDNNELWSLGEREQAPTSAENGRCIYIHIYMYRIAGNFRRCKFSYGWLETLLFKISYA